MAKKSADSPEAVLASANAANSKVSSRQYEGTGVAVSAPGNSGGYGGTPVAKHYAYGDPSVQPIASRQQTEKMGATYFIVAGINKPTDPAYSGKTYANGKLLAPATNRSGQFWAGGS